MNDNNSTALTNAMVNFIHSDQAAGLCLMDAPTGAGKTYASVHCILDLLASPSEKTPERFFLITPRKKNLPLEDLKRAIDRDERFTEAEKEKLLDSILYVQPYSESILKLEDPSGLWMKEKIENLIQEYGGHDRKEHLKKFSSLLFYIRQYQESRKKPEHSVQTDHYHDELTRLEREFRKIIGQDCKEAGKKLDSEDSQADILDLPAFRFLQDLYPSSLLEKKKIILMSFDKFILPMDTIAHGLITLPKSSLIKNSVVFLDEVDSSKNDCLSQITSSEAEAIDLVAFFRDIHHSLIHDELNQNFLQIVDRTRKSGTSTQKILEQLAKEADRLHQKYSLQYSFYYETETARMVPLFFDQQQLELSREGLKYIAVPDPEQKFNRIRTVSDAEFKQRMNGKKWEDEDKDLFYPVDQMTQDLHHFIQRYLGMIQSVVFHYARSLALSRKETDPDVKRERIQDESNDEKIRTVLNHFRIENEREQRFIKNYLQSSFDDQNLNSRSGYHNPQYPLYSHGFSYTLFSNQVNFMTKFIEKSLLRIPENILLEICTRAKVVGISATATMPTLLHNYDLEYLDYVLGTGRYQMPPADLEAVQKDFDRLTEGYQNLELHAEFLAEKSSLSVSDLERFLPDPAIEHDLLCGIENEVNADQASPDQNRVESKVRDCIQILTAYQKFLQSENSESFLGLLNGFPKESLKLLLLAAKWFFEKRDLKRIRRGIQRFQQAEDADKNAMLNKNGIYILDTAGFDRTFHQIQNDLQSGKKTAVFSTYQTIGTGQNLQYPVSEERMGDCVRVNDRRGNKKDFDTLYLQKPTNLAVNLFEDLDDAARYQALYEVMYLELYSHLSRRASKARKKEALNPERGNIRSAGYSISEIYKSIDAFFSTDKIIKQAIGRICRTSLKSPRIMILADYEIARPLLADQPSGWNNPEYLKLHQAAANLIADSDPGEAERRELNRLSNRSVKANKCIRSRFLSKRWNEPNMKEWQALRDFVMRYPTLSEEEVLSLKEQKPFIGYYLQMDLEKPEYWYSQSGDYRDIQISCQRSEECQQKVSSSAARLDLLMKMDSLRKFAVENGYAVEFIRNPYILCPPAFNNIYKGAIGEFFGKFILEEYCQMELEEITDPELFELADYKVSGTDIYVDFKNWNHRAEGELDLDWIDQKMKKLGAGTLLVINLADESPRMDNFHLEHGLVSRITGLISVADSENPEFASEIQSSIRERKFDDDETE